MTPRERAANVVMDFHARRSWAYDPVQHAELEGLIAEAIRQAVVEERERCARIADGVAKKAFYGIDESHTDPWAAGRSAGADEIAEAIRGVTSPAGG